MKKNIIALYAILCLLPTMQYALPSWYNTITSKISDTASSAASKISDTASSAASKISDTASSAASKVSSIVSSGMNTIKGTSDTVVKQVHAQLFAPVLIAPQESATTSVYEIQNSSDRVIEVIDDWKGRFEVIQPALLDSTIDLRYRVLEASATKTQLSFPQDFMVEIPKILLPLNGKKSFHDAAFLGSHNCFANLTDGFLYNQQGTPSVKTQIQHGVRMLRPAYHNPSGSMIDSPNREAILCHSDDHQCGTVSLATRGFRPHQLVVNFNTLVLESLNRYQNDIFVIGVNNFLTDAQTDIEFERVAGLSEKIVTPADLQDENNQQTWQGLWPTIDWMRSTGKRLVILNDHTTKYTLSYNDYVRRNMYGVKTVQEAAVARGVGSGAMIASPKATLVELSWFQSISLPIYDQSILQTAASLYDDYLVKVPTILAKALAVPAKLLAYIGLGQQRMAYPLQNFLDFISMVASKVAYLASLGIPSSLINKVKANQSKIDDVMKKIEEYKPIRQDNSFATLQKLIIACRANNVLDVTQMPNIIMLDFVTTGGGLAMINCLNMVKDHQLGLDFVNVGGFSYDGQLLDVTGLI